MRTLAEALEDEQTLVNRMIVEMEHPTAGTVRMLDAPIRLSATPATVRRVPPRLGEHNAEVLRDHGFTDAEVAALPGRGCSGDRLLRARHPLRAGRPRRPGDHRPAARAQRRRPVPRTWSCDEIWAEIEGDPDVRAVVLTGAGDRAFCVGADMSAAGVDKTGMEYWADLDPNGFGGLTLRESLDVPVIARVNGYALGGGMEMVLGCDIVVAAETAQLRADRAAGRAAAAGRRDGEAGPADPVPPGDGPAAHRPQGAGRGDVRLGLVNEVVPAAELDDAVQRWVDDVLACAPLSLRAIKQIVQRTAHLTAREANAVRLPALVAALESEDSDEGVRAFQEKRAPEWSGS